MKWSGRARKFGIRFVVCLVVLGGVYIAVFGLKPAPKPALVSPTQKLAALRSALEETYLAGNSLADWQQSDGTAAESLDNLRSQFETATNRMQTAFKDTPAGTVTPIKPTIEAVIDRARKASQSYRASNTVLTKTINYNPSTDIGTLPLDTSLAKLAARAAAAQKGLLKAANSQATVAATVSGLSVQNNNGPALLVEPATQAALRTEADCLGQLSDQATAGAAVAAAQTRSQCIGAYPALRRAAIQNITRPAWGGDYHDFAQRTVPPLLRQLDQLIKS